MFLNYGKTKQYYLYKWSKNYKKVVKKLKKCKIIFY